MREHARRTVMRTKLGAPTPHEAIDALKPSRGRERPAGKMLSDAQSSEVSPGLRDDDAAYVIAMEYIAMAAPLALFHC